ncbi:hypothetical protein BGX28_002405 [Mortierella sp. GBA30]|nr:hypothetical protein BGX28_002405 [Mortierella sp. GBA30]
MFIHIEQQTRSLRPARYPAQGVCATLQLVHCFKEPEGKVLDDNDTKLFSVRRKGEKEEEAEEDEVRMLEAAAMTRNISISDISNIVSVIISDSRLVIPKPAPTTSLPPGQRVPWKMMPTTTCYRATTFDSNILGQFATKPVSPVQLKHRRIVYQVK